MDRTMDGIANVSPFTCRRYLIRRVPPSSKDPIRCPKTASCSYGNGGLYATLH
jgi:hypothetical protein